MSFWLIFRHQKIDDEALKDISEGIKARSGLLKELSIGFDWQEHMKTIFASNNEITDVGLGFFSEALKTLDSLETLTISFDM